MHVGKAVVPVRVVAAVPDNGLLEIDQVMTPPALIVGVAVNVLIPIALPLVISAVNRVRAAEVVWWQVPPHA